MALEKIIKVDESAIGSTVTRDVRGDTGAIVCSVGDRLGARLVLKLRRAGISSVYVKRHLAHGGKRGVDNRLSELDRKFARVEADPIMHALKRVLAERIKEKARGGT